MRILVTGASGLLGSYLLRELRIRDIPALAWSGSRSGQLFGFNLRPVDFVDADKIASAFREAQPSVVIHAGAVSTIAECFRDPDRAWQINTQGSRILTELAAETGTRVILLSTDMAFDGQQGWYREDDAPSPLSVYGRTKVAAEQVVLAYPRGVVVRMSLLFGPSRIDRGSFFDEQVRAIREHRPCILFEDEWRTPLDLATAAQALLAVADSDFVGVLHIGGPERLSRLEMGQRLAAMLGADPAVVVPSARADVASKEPRPRDISLDSSRVRILFPNLAWPTWETAIRKVGFSATSASS